MKPGMHRAEMLHELMNTVHDTTSSRNIFS